MQKKKLAKDKEKLTKDIVKDLEKDLSRESFAKFEQDVLQNVKRSIRFSKNSSAGIEVEKTSRTSKKPKAELCNPDDPDCGWQPPTWYHISYYEGWWSVSGSEVTETDDGTTWYENGSATITFRHTVELNPEANVHGLTMTTKIENYFQQELAQAATIEMDVTTQTLFVNDVSYSPYIDESGMPDGSVHAELNDITNCSSPGGGGGPVETGDWGISLALYNYAGRNMNGLWTWTHNAHSSENCPTTCGWTIPSLLVEVPIRNVRTPANRMRVGSLYGYYGCTRAWGWSFGLIYRPATAYPCFDSEWL